MERRFCYIVFLGAYNRLLCGAENGTRTRDPNLGKVVLYQLSYFRMFSLNGLFFKTCQRISLSVATVLCFGVGYAVNNVCKVKAFYPKSQNNLHILIKLWHNSTINVSANRFFPLTLHKQLKTVAVSCFCSCRKHSCKAPFFQVCKRPQDGVCSHSSTDRTEVS